MFLAQRILRGLTLSASRVVVILCPAAIFVPNNAGFADHSKPPIGRQLSTQPARKLVAGNTTLASTVAPRIVTATILVRPVQLHAMSDARTPSVTRDAMNLVHLVLRRRAHLLVPIVNARCRVQHPATGCLATRGANASCSADTSAHRCVAKSVRPGYSAKHARPTISRRRTPTISLWRPMPRSI